MKIDIKKDINFRIFKGCIKKRTPNPWICAFLLYLREHPSANESDICRALFCDNGEARRSAVRNILFFFRQQGLVTYDRQRDNILTADGKAAFEEGKVWQSMEGAFLTTFWIPVPGTLPIVLGIMPVPEKWYDFGKESIVPIPDYYGKNFESLIVPEGIRVASTGKSMRGSYVDVDWKADLNPRSGLIKISSSNTEKSKFFECVNFEDILLESTLDDVCNRYFEESEESEVVQDS